LEDAALRNPPAIGESWEISDVAGKSQRDRAGRVRRHDLRTLGAARGSILGKRGARSIRAGPVLLLIKLLVREADLSVQIIPRRRRVRRAHEQRQRPMDHSRRGQSRGSFWTAGRRIGGALRYVGSARRALTRGQKRLFRQVVVERGDVVFVPAGTIPRRKGVLLLEVSRPPTSRTGSTTGAAPARTASRETSIFPGRSPSRMPSRFPVRSPAFRERRR
jgi:hypothetical protein